MAKIELKNRIRRLRFEHDETTQQELANCVKVTRQTIIALEANKYSPSLALAFRIAKVFGVPVEEVFQYNTPDAGEESSNEKSKLTPEPEGQSSKLNHSEEGNLL